jgi:hypothetical protein
MPPVPGDLGEIPDLANGAVRNILRQIVGCAWFGNLDAACVSAAAVEGMASRIVHVHSVDDEVVIVESGHERWSGGGPEPVGALHHVQLRIAPEVELHRRGIRGLDAELGSAAGVDARVFRAPHIGGSRLKTVTGSLCVAVARKQKYRELQFSSFEFSPFSNPANVAAEKVICPSMLPRPERRSIATSSASLPRILDTGCTRASGLGRIRQSQIRAGIRNDVVAALGNSKCPTSAGPAAASPTSITGARGSARATSARDCELGMGRRDRYECLRHR